MSNEQVILNDILKLVTFTPCDDKAPTPPEVFACAHIILISANGEIYLTKETKNDFYNLPGGGKKPNETPEQTATRETAEELGIKLDKEDLHYIGSLVLRGHTMFPIFTVQNANKYHPMKMRKIETIALELMDFIKTVKEINQQIGPFLDLVVAYATQEKNR
jgi:ADP-ribose pyrophosphatase YjhB (NUDIX family)